MTASTVTWTSIATRIRGVANTSTNLRANTQSIACDIIALGETESGEARNAPAKALALVKALGEGVNAKALETFFAMFSPINVSGKENTAGFRSQLHKKGSKRGEPNPLYRPWSATDAAAVMWWTCKTQKEAAFIDADTAATMLQKLLANIAAVVNGDEDAKFQVKPENVDTLEAWLHTTRAALTAAIPAPAIPSELVNVSDVVGRTAQRGPQAIAA